jgi:hypothetical protein
MMRITTTLLALAFLAPSLAHGNPKGDIGKRVDTHLRRGIEFYAEKQYELAIVEFRAGYALDPRPDFLFALAQAERLSGDCPSAVVYYRRYLTTNPGTNQAEAARVNMRRCTRALESAPADKRERTTDAELDSAEQASEPAPPPAPPAPLVVKAPAPAPAPWYSDKIALSLLGSSAAALALGGGFWMAKSSAESAADSATSDVEYDQHLARARRNRTISLVGFGVGAALAAGTAYRLITRRTSASEERTHLTAAPTSGGAAVVLLGSF